MITIYGMSKNTHRLRTYFRENYLTYHLIIRNATLFLVMSGYERGIVVFDEGS